MTLLPEQREALIDALIENWPWRDDENVLDDAIFDREELFDYSDDELIEYGQLWCPGRLVELGIKVEG